ncbi:MAG: response regulator transcription factor [Acidiferrobacterales bacterium]|nr:response regulator transcription factor [Acidiferrobacterales bacterium]
MSLVKKILAVDDHRLFLEGLRHLLIDLDGGYQLELVDDVESAIRHIDEGHRYSLIIVDLSLPGMDGFSLLQSLSKRRVFTPSVVLSSSSNMSDIKRAMQLGALGFISKAATSNEMLTAINQVIQGNIYLPDDVWPHMDDYPGSQQADIDNNCEQSVGERQLDVLNLLVDGLSNKAIATVLNIGESTVKYHVGILFKYYKVTSRTALIKKSQELGSLQNRD